MPGELLGSLRVAGNLPLDDKYLSPSAASLDTDISTGLLRFTTDTEDLYIHKSAGWEKVGTPPQYALEVKSIDGTSKKILFDEATKTTQFTDYLKIANPGDYIICNSNSELAGTLGVFCEGLQPNVIVHGNGIIIGDGFNQHYYRWSGPGYAVFHDFVFNLQRNTTFKVNSLNFSQQNTLELVGGAINFGDPATQLGGTFQLYNTILILDGVKADNGNFALDPSSDFSKSLIILRGSTVIDLTRIPFVKVIDERPLLRTYIDYPNELLYLSHPVNTNYVEVVSGQSVCLTLDTTIAAATPVISIDISPKSSINGTTIELRLREDQVYKAVIKSSGTKGFGVNKAANITLEIGQVIQLRLYIPSNLPTDSYWIIVSSYKIPPKIIVPFAERLFQARSSNGILFRDGDAFSDSMYFLNNNGGGSLEIKGDCVIDPARYVNSTSIKLYSGYATITLADFLKTNNLTISNTILKESVIINNAGGSNGTPVSSFVECPVILYNCDIYSTLSNSSDGGILLVNCILRTPYWNGGPAAGGGSYYLKNCLQVGSIGYGNNYGAVNIL